jgi:hypothetical protein
MSFRIPVGLDRSMARQLGLWSESGQAFRLSEQQEQQLLRLLAELLMGAARRSTVSNLQVHEEDTDE